MRRLIRDALFVAGIVAAFVVLGPVYLVKWALGR